MFPNHVMTGKTCKTLEACAMHQLKAVKGLFAIIKVFY